MKILKPSWLSHRDENKFFDIYSIDVSPDGKRLASGGLDGKVCLWSTDHVLEVPNPSKTRLLSSMSTHTGAVTNVRFAPHGRYLASGSDDRVVLIWEHDLDAAPMAEFGATEAESERWIVRKRCVGHDNDVQDLAWAPDSSILVSVGLDSVIIVWSGSTFEKLKRIDAHQSLVKGITFDPAGKFFATASDDRTVKIFRYHRSSPTEFSFSLEQTITKPFEDSPLTTYFRRLSWSPEGNHIAAANAINGPVPTVAIISRGSWSCDISLIGHEAPIEVVTFSPRIYSSLSDKRILATYIAAAGQDKSVSVWNTTNPRPLFVAQNSANKTFTDLRWSPDGLNLYAASMDGSIVVFCFTESELGLVVPMSENEKQLAKFGGGGDMTHFPESVKQLELERIAAEKESIQNESRMNDLMGDSQSKPITATKPVSAEPTSTSTSTPAPETAVARSDTATELTSGAAAASAPATAPPSVNSNSNAASATNTPTKQKVSITKDGRKRVAPQLVSTSRSQQDNVLSSAPIVTAQHTNQQLVTSDNRTAVEYSKPSNVLPSGGISTLVVGNKRRLKVSEDNDKENGNDTKRTATDSVDKLFPDYIRPAVVSPALVMSHVRLATPKVQTVINFRSNKYPFVLEIRNGSGSERAPTRLILSEKDTIIWQDFLPRTVILATASLNFWTALTEDGSVHIYSPAGRRILPPIVLESVPCFAECNDRFLMVLTSAGQVYAWDILARKALHAPVSVAPILDSAALSDHQLHKAPSITQCGISESGAPLISLTTGDSYAYSSEMLSWHRISESWWAVGSQYWDSSVVRKLGGIIGAAERRTDSQLLLQGRGRLLQRLVKAAQMREGCENIGSVVSTGHLENRLGVAILLNLSEELKNHMLMYARLLAQEGLKDRLEELFSELLGPGDADPSWDPLLCGYKKQDLLREILQAIGRIREVQKITVPYAEALGIVKDVMDVDS
ncbi:hypothetical protein CANCADRAFT_133403 [Tortispora caseinolytica NRRL Y-17796]|uniref:Protein HIR n=1 Tax=Tortispora caseinolytica NRRL Y-17796 TaxID=767744 RepID=A0A1E4TBD3_9ASCO|nr:hypothetical protein CANCADRAFT_133403 [Tortispora caseinolytica NRRL Y-17796]